jgi:deoxycytidylate deaminase
MRKTVTKKKTQHLSQKPISSDQLPSFDRYYIDLAEAVSRRANCLGKKVGAVVIVGNRIVFNWLQRCP